ncbi:MAG: hypothetical protein AAGI07_09415 [Bacteroidota bacterium]
MKVKWLHILLLLGIVYSSCAQEFQYAFKEKQYEITKVGMLTLGSWALGNIAINGALVSQAEGSTKYFHEMNIYWNLVNLAIAGGGYWVNNKNRNKAYSPYDLVKEQAKIEKTLLFNAGLDVAYMAIGQLLKERAKNINDRLERLKGFGNGLILQGAFLFVFDLSLHAIHVHHRNKAQKNFQQIKFSLNISGIRMYF